MKHIQTFEGFLTESNNNGVWIYLDDIRTPIDKKWVVVRNYKDFIKTVEKHGIDNISKISFDHDLNDFSGGIEKTGKTAANWFIETFMDMQESGKISGEHFPEVTVHSDNPVGVQNIIGLINPFLKMLNKQSGNQYTQALAGKPLFKA